MIPIMMIAKVWDYFLIGLAILFLLCVAGIIVWEVIIKGCKDLHYN